MTKSKKSNTQKKSGNNKKAKGTGISRTVSAPVSRGKVLKHLGEPNIKPHGLKGDCIVSHKEYCFDLSAAAVAGQFSVQGTPINPGNNALFPWLSQIAGNYESYRFKKLQFQFDTSSPTSVPGVVLMAVDYDVTDAKPASKRDIMSYRGAVRSPVWEDITFTCLSEDLSKRKTYFVNDLDSLSVNFAPLSVLNDLRLDDCGELLIATSGSNAGAVLGEIYVTYEIELMTPEYSPNDVGGFWSWTVAYDASYHALTAIRPFGPVTSFVRDSYSTIYDDLAIKFSSPAGNNRFSFGQIGTYLVEFTMFPAAATTNFNVTWDSSPYNSRVNSFTSGITATRATYSTIAVVQNTVPLDITGALSYVEPALVGSTFSSSNDYSRLRIVRIPDYVAGSAASVSLDVDKPLWCCRKREKKHRPFTELITENSSELAGNASPIDREKESPLDYVRDCPNDIRIYPDYSKSATLRK